MLPIVGSVLVGGPWPERPLFVVFRAICEAELSDVAAARGFRGAVDGSSLEAKLFAQSASDAARFGRAVFGHDGRQVFTAAVLLTETGYRLLQPGWADGATILSADRDDLPRLNDEIVLVVALEVNSWP